MNSLEFMNYCDEMMITEESFASLMDGAMLLGQKVADSLEDILNSVIAYIHAFIAKMRGYKMYREFATPLMKIISVFEKMVDKCTYDANKFVQGFMMNKMGEFQGTDFFIGAPAEYNAELTELQQEIAKWKDRVVTEGVEGLTVLDYRKTVEVQKAILRLSTKLRNLTRKIRFTPAQRKQIEFMNLGDFVKNQENTNKLTILKMSNIFLDACSCVLIKNKDKTKNMKGGK